MSIETGEYIFDRKRSFWSSFRFQSKHRTFLNASRNFDYHVFDVCMYVCSWT